MPSSYSTTLKSALHLSLSMLTDRVEQIAQAPQLELEGSLNLSSLAHSIHQLINASTTLDQQTEKDVEKLHKLLPPPPHHPPHGHHGHGKKPLKMIWYKLCSAWSSKCERKLAKHHPDHHGHPEPSKLPKKKVAEIKKVLEAIRAGNKKRQAFEGGFISEDGIKVCAGTSGGLR